MESVEWIPEEKLVRDPRRVLDAVQDGALALLERDGEAIAAILDMIDFRIVRAVARAHVREMEIDPEAGLTDEAVAALPDAQARYDLVWAYYMAQGLSLARAAELLGLGWFDLRLRCTRLGVPVWTGPATLEELEEDVRVAASAIPTSPTPSSSGPASSG